MTSTELVETIARVSQQVRTASSEDSHPALRTDTRAQVAALIDHTILRPDATRADVVAVCREAKQFDFASVCVNPFWVSLVSAELNGSAVKTCSVVGFPLGANKPEFKAQEAAAAIADGATEVDMVINVGELRAQNYDAVYHDILGVVEVSHSQGAIVKVIIETALLDDAQKIAASVIAKQAGADFVKTSTGFSKSGATAADVSLMRRVVGPHVGVKASGGIRTLEDLRAMVNAGANRIGASASVKIIEALGS